MNGKSVTVIGFVAVLLMGCEAEMTPEQLYSAGKPISMPAYKSNATVAQLENDKLNCNIEAVQRVPQNIQVRTTPTYTTPTYTTCNRVGYSVLCNTTGGQTYGGNTYSEDANAGLRAQANAQCLARKGYRSVQIPPCPSNVTPAQLKTYGNRLPPLGRTTCYIAKDGVQTFGNL